MVTTDQVKEQLAGHLHLTKADNSGADVTKLSGFWNPIVTRAHKFAEDWLRAALAIRFDSQAVALSALFYDYWLQLALFWCGVWGSEALTESQRALLMAMDCRKEVMELTSLGSPTEGRYSASGVFTQPTSGTRRNPLAAPEYDRVYGDIPYPAM
jgi:hypothetical protein